MSLPASWQFRALAAAIFAKIGISDIDSDLATFIRTCVIMLVLGAILTAMGKWRNPQTIPLRTWVFLGLSGLATGASWLAWFRALKLADAARVAPLDKLLIVLVAIFGVLFLGEHLFALKSR